MWIDGSVLPLNFAWQSFVHKVKLDGIRVNLGFVPIPREGRYPTYFDGVVASAPATLVATGASLNSIDYCKPSIGKRGLKGAWGQATICFHKFGDTG